MDGKVTRIQHRRRAGGAGRAGAVAAGLCLALLLPAAPAFPAERKPKTATAALLSPAGPARLTVAAEAPSFRLRPDTLASFTPQTLDVGRFAFTVPGRQGPAPGAPPVERSFRFTPSGSPDRKAVTLGVTARGIAPAQTPAPPQVRATAAADRALPTVAFNLDLAVGWNGFALSGGVSRLDSGMGGGVREGVDVAFSYGGRNWKTSVQATAERSPPLVLRQFDDVERYGIEAGGTYALGRSLSVLGGVRYRTAPLNPSLLDLNADDKSVYLGGAFAF